MGFMRKKNDRNLVKAVLIDQLYNDMKKMLECKTAEDCQGIVKEFINFYCLKEHA